MQYSVQLQAKRDGILSNRGHGLKALKAGRMKTHHFGAKQTRALDRLSGGERWMETKKVAIDQAP